MMPKTLLVWTVCAALAPALARAESAREMLDQAKAVNDAREPKDTSQRTKMTLVDSRGGERIRDLDVYRKNYGHRTRKALTFFLSPPEVRGVGFLSWSYPDRNDDQWLYLPELKRVRQISGASRKQSFQGSDFTYDDLELLIVLNNGEYQSISLTARVAANPHLLLSTNFKVPEATFANFPKGERFMPA